MTEEAKATEKTTAKKVTVTKSPAKKSSAKASKFVCGTCGLTIAVDDWGNMEVGEIICCEKQMKAKK
ncbi:MAG: hypothetical protein N3E40_01660 [Dehalococcoidia bacterium]|nr:hypothetical protein [Dehalococcoidia bacterium]